jgi:hypothetical protein
MFDTALVVLESLGIKDEAISIFIRVLIISFSTLGVVFSAEKYFNTNVSAHIKRLVAFYSVIILSFLFTLWKDYLTMWSEGRGTAVSVITYILESVFYGCISLVFYAVVCFKIFNILNIIVFERFLKIQKPVTPTRRRHTTKVHETHEAHETHENHETPPEHT